VNRPLSLRLQPSGREWVDRLAARHSRPTSDVVKEALRLVASDPALTAKLERRLGNACG
jgi:predicted DNA-binding protein